MLLRKPDVRLMPAAVEQERWVTLNAKQRCEQASEFERALFDRIVAQDEAVGDLVNAAELCPPSSACVVSGLARSWTFGVEGRCPARNGSQDDW